MLPKDRNSKNIQLYELGTTDALEKSLGKGLFGSFKWLNLLNQEYDYNFYVLKHINDQSSFPFAHIKFADFEKIVSLPFSDYLIPNLNNESQLKSYLSIIEEKFPQAKIQLKWLIGESLDVSEKGYKFTETAYLHRVSTSNKEDIKNNMSASFRNKVNQAVRANLSVKISYELSDVEEFYRTYYELRIHKFKKIPQSFSFFKKLWSEYIDKKQGFVMKVTIDGLAIAFAICLKHEDIIYFKYSCSKKDYLHHRPNNLLMNELFTYASDNGFSSVDLGLSGLGKAYEGLVSFKESMGGAPSIIKSLEVVPKKYDSDAESKMNELTGSLTHTIIENDPGPEMTSVLSKSLYRYFV
jgi:hypothetical protein